MLMGLAGGVAGDGREEVGRLPPIWVLLEGKAVREVADASIGESAHRRAPCSLSESCRIRDSSLSATAPCRALVSLVPAFFKPAPLNHAGLQEGRPFVDFTWRLGVVNE